MSPQSYSKLIVISILTLFLSGKSFAQNASLTINTDPKITQLLELKKDLEKENKLSDGYTIQLYYGELDKANQILRKYRGSYGNWPASIEYETPNYKVWAGNFASRIEAERALLEIQKSFSSAFILKPDRRK
ncbi:MULTISPECIES: SPOR domain-containing protein [Aequorivita]|uniref:SPOR domain-containing protein n=1 Tax=Aequorivita iocasae TaxID=2803865 RepID=A0ABX7DWB9_9FLAO|nr:MULTISPECIES: SPOR domain-containing protein [Aequorivita]QQX77891.1 SPOR domain-containing protein [Aequorivita iocasae]UCA57390.1 SPOR domain-containing protein [Aequorivita sp. F7]